MPDCFYDEVFGEFGNGYLNSFALFTCKLVKTSKVEPPGWPEDAESDEFDEVWVATLWRFTFNLFRGWK